MRSDAMSGRLPCLREHGPGLPWALGSAVPQEPCIRSCIRPCMATEVVQFRYDPAGLQFLRNNGLAPNEVAREAFRAEMRRLEALDQMEQLRQLGPIGPFPDDHVQKMRTERGRELGRRLR